MFLVLGITGQTGSATAAALLDQGQPVRALVRSAARAADWGARGVELVEGEANDVAALARAMAGVKGAFVMVPPAPTHPDPIAWYAEVAQAVREAAQQARLPHLVLLSSEGAQLESGTGPVRGLHKAEAILADAAGRTTLLRPAWFQENWRAFLGLAAGEGILPSLLPSLERRRPMVATDDIGTAAAEALTAAEPPALIELAGPEDYAPADVARAMEQALGRPVAPVVPPRETWPSMLTGAGLGEAFAALVIELYEGIDSGHVGFSGDVPLSRGTTRLEDNVRAWHAQTAVHEAA